MEDFQGLSITVWSQLNTVRTSCKADPAVNQKVMSPHRFDALLAIQLKGRILNTITSCLGVLSRKLSCCDLFRLPFRSSTGCVCLQVFSLHMYHIGPFQQPGSYLYIRAAPFTLV